MKKFGNGIIFKSGTALCKCFGIDRFSEDLDFDIIQEINFKKIENGLKDFKIEFSKEEKSFERSKKIILKIKGPLYNGSKNSLCKLELDFSLREKVEKKPITKKIGKFIEEILTFEVLVMEAEEILSEKFRAIITRNKARDFYDIYFLIEIGTKINYDLINKKLKYYSLKYNEKIFLKKLKEKKDIWKSEMGRLIENVPDFNKTIKKIKIELESKLSSLMLDFLSDYQRASNKFLNDPQKHKEHVEQTEKIL